MIFLFKKIREKLRPCLFFATWKARCYLCACYGFLVYLHKLCNSLLSAAGRFAWECTPCSPFCIQQNLLSHLPPLMGRSKKFGQNLGSSFMKETFCCFMKETFCLMVVLYTFNFILVLCQNLWHCLLNQNVKGLLRKAVYRRHIRMNTKILVSLLFFLHFCNCSVNCFPSESLFKLFSEVKKRSFEIKCDADRYFQTQVVTVFASPFKRIDNKFVLYVILISGEWMLVDKCQGLALVNRFNVEEVFKCFIRNTQFGALVWRKASFKAVNSCGFPWIWGDKNSIGTRVKFYKIFRTVKGVIWTWTN